MPRVEREDLEKIKEINPIENHVRTNKKKKRKSQLPQTKLPSKSKLKRTLQRGKEEEEEGEKDNNDCILRLSNIANNCNRLSLSVLIHHLGVNSPHAI